MVEKVSKSEQLQKRIWVIMFQVMRKKRKQMWTTKNISSCFEIKILNLSGIHEQTI